MFFVFKIPYNELLSENTKAVFSAYRGRVVFQECLSVPQELREYEFVPYEYEKLLILKRAQGILCTAFAGNAGTSLLIIDKRGRRLRNSLPLIALTEKVFVKTSSEDCFDAFSERAFSGYGAIVYRFRGKCGADNGLSTDDKDCACNENDTDDADYMYDVFLEHSVDSGSFSGSAVLDFDKAVLVLRSSSVLGTRTDYYKPIYPVLPHELESALPFGINRERFLSAMYDVCRFRIENSD